MSNQIIFSLFSFIVGTLWGSFANVVIFRFNKESVVLPRSHCVSCNQLIAWYDNIPLFSWLALRARCRKCKAPISWQYPLLELFAGFAGLVCYQRFGFSISSLITFTSVMILVVIGIIDLRHYIISIGMLLILVCVSLVSSIYSYWDFVRHFADAGVSDFSYFVMPKIIGAVVGFAFMACILIIFTYLARAMGRIAKDQLAMGWGDPLLVAALGALLGWRALPWVVAVGCLQGALLFVLFQRFFKKHLNEENHDGDLPQQSVPLGTFLCLGAVELILFWPSLSL